MRDNSQSTDTLRWSEETGLFKSVDARLELKVLRRGETSVGSYLDKILVGFQRTTKNKIIIVPFDIP